MSKKTSFKILTTLIGLDIGLTILFVTQFNATEINPLCLNFVQFMIIKIIISTIGLVTLYKIRTTPGWSIFVGILISIYGILLTFNLYGVVTEFII